MELLNKENLLSLYPGYTKVLGPYKRKDGRKHVVLNNENLPKGVKGKLRTISYPKALVESVNCKRLKDNETIDHIDRDFTNNNLANLQIIDRAVHSSIDAKRRKEIFAPCVYCKRVFKLSRFQINSRAKAGPFCSKKCSGRYGKEIPLGSIEPKGNTQYKPQYFYLDKN